MNFTMILASPTLRGALLLALATVAACAAEPRRTLSLNGDWDIAEGTMDQVPARFEHQVPVPGLVDMAQPPFAEVGTGNSGKLRKAFWYRRSFQLSEAVPAVALFKVHKAAYGARVYLNGTLLGEHLPSFTPGYFDGRTALRGNGLTNELIIRVGAHRDAVPPNIPAGWDFEKVKYIPGIFDAVELILCGSPHIVRVQTAPDITNHALSIEAVLEVAGPGPASPGKEVPLQWTVREARSGKVVARLDTAVSLSATHGGRTTARARLALPDCRLWSPEDPFLYELELSTGADTLRTRFGMRSFCFDPATGRACLNGKPRFLRGSNVTLYRFFEDPLRGDRPWRAEWVRRLHQQFKQMHWEALRYCIGFPPEFWYDIADEEGFLIQDEFPIWHLGNAKDSPKADELAREYAEWMEERWNHPCVIIWDAQNETVTEETGRAIQRVRALDLSNRPWDNGWGPPQAPGDCYESHPYLSSNPQFKLSDLARVNGRPGGNPAPNQGTNAILINEYGWLWLNRDGTPTTLTREVYKNLLGTNATPAQRFYLYARLLAAKTEFWRAHRQCAGVLHFCGLGYSRPNGQTSDHFIDLEKLTYQPDFFEFVRDAFAPVGLMIDEWAAEWAPGQARTIPVIVINDLERPWQGQLRFRLEHGSKLLAERSEPCEVPAFGQQRLTFPCAAPLEPGGYRIEAALVKPGENPVRSLRDFEVLSPEQKAARDGLAVGRPVRASSAVTKDGTTYRADFAVDGERTTRWSSEFSDPQWLAVDLAAPTRIGRVELLWERAAAKAFAIQVSLEGTAWQDVYTTEKGAGGTESIRFAPVTARWVRLYGTQRSTEFGYSLWEFRVFKE
jgi:beta-galactosidase